MSRSFLSISIVVVIMAVLVSCQKADSSKTETEKNDSVSIEKNEVNPSTSTLKSKEEVIEFLSDVGFLLNINGKDIYREDQLSDANPNDIIRSVEVLSADSKKNKTAIFYLMIGGASLINTSDQQRFIQKNVNDGNYLAFIDKMVKFLQRQDRPVIKQALLNTTSSLTVGQCIAYLQYIEYLSGTIASSFSYDPTVLKPLPVFFKLSLLNKLKNAEGQGAMVHEQLKLDLGIVG